MRSTALYTYNMNVWNIGDNELLRNGIRTDNYNKSNSASSTTIIGWHIYTVKYLCPFIR
jgi:hypothetical protein